MNESGWRNRNTSDNPREYTPGDVKEIESRADVASLEGLQHDRREATKKHLRLLALFGNFGLFDVCRKALVEACKVEARMRLKEAGEKITDDRVESEAYGDSKYQMALDRALEDKMECLLALDEIDSLTERIRSREIELNAYNAELRLSK